MWSSSGSQFVMSSNTSVAESPLHSIAQYIEDYMDLVENVPNDIARQITQLHEHNHRYHQLLAQLESTLDLVCNKTTNELKKRNSMIKIQRSLIEVQEIADEKLLLIQSILDQLDGKARQLDFDYRSVTYNSSSNVTNNSRVQMQTTASLVANNYTSSQRSEANNSSVNVPSNSNAVTTTAVETAPKEVVNGTTNGLSNDNLNVSASHSGGKRASARRNTGSRSNDNNNENSSSKRSVKRGVKTSHKDMKRSRNSINNINSNSNSSLLMANSSPPIYEGAPIDPDEPTYCLCDQVSFGEMICCDNSDCKIEWFHFSCVSLNTKPKGKWFCPNCRGDRSNIQKK